MSNKFLVKVASVGTVGALLIPTAFAQVSTSTIDSVVTSSLSTLTSVLTTNLPLVIGFAVSIIGLMLAWKYFRRFIGGKK